MHEGARFLASGSRAGADRTARIQPDQRGRSGRELAPQRLFSPSIFRNEASITRLIGAVLLEQNDEWLLQCGPSGAPRNSSSHRTRRWSKRDSNPWSLLARAWPSLRRREGQEIHRDGCEWWRLFRGRPEVRIPLAPPASPFPEGAPLPRLARISWNSMAQGDSTDAAPTARPGAA